MENEVKKAHLGMDKAPVAYYGVYLCTIAFLYANYLVGMLVCNSSAEKPLLPWEAAVAVCAIMVTVSSNEAIKLAHKGLDTYKNKD